MAITKYNLTAFVRDKAISGSLCVCVSGATIPESIKSDNAAFVGAGIPVYKDYRFHLTVNSILYIFDDKGEPANAAAASKKLVLGSIEKAMVGRGNVVSTYNTGSNATRGEGGYDTATVSYNNTPTNVSIDSLNARDHFAVQALQTLLARMEKDPATLSDDEMVYWSDVAYKWASSMMVAAANARADTSDTRPSETPSDAPIQSLDSNTEKLLNNIEVAIKRTDYSTGTPAEYFKKIMLGNTGIGGNNERPFFVTTKGYNTKEQAEADGWAYSTVDEWWEKDGFEPIKSAYTNIGARTLPTNKISIAEMPALIAAIDRLIDAIQNN